MKLSNKNTAILTLDFQNGILDHCPGAGDAIANAAKIAEFARKNGFFMIHVGLGFSEGHPEIPDFESPFLMLKKHGLFVKGTSSAEFLPSVAKTSELKVYKQRYCAFSENNLNMILRSQKIENLVLFGIATSGILLSTVRRAFDLDYRLNVISDASFDNDPEVHRVLVDKVFPRQSTVVSTDAFIAEQKA